ncbi:LPXTG cell wall anchor domain-containing protein [Bacillus shivajii]|uniref:LPXTG cell wall anchor domain-containing protein n=1 Tax=Bacillus shivajii TaxID=1983719 RepID=UPI001CFBAC2F|nr:LPXTG cell wall anchor domain-containing protein [Bacillus shivajii]UCZ53176.1 LPXTG cell wall anchor domain-containing protein [Bacillus shivajii]
MKRFISILTVFILVFSYSASAIADSHGEPPIEELEEQFKNLIEVETDDDQKVVEFDSTEQFEQAFHQIMSDELADFYLGQYFKEDDDGYYHLPQDAPAYIDFEQEYTLEEVNNNQYHLTQSREDALRGEFTLTVHYEYANDQWIIADRNDLADVEEGGELPDTATSYPLWTIAGLILAGTGVILITRKQLVNNQ